jgi:hypothetical protein
MNLAAANTMAGSVNRLLAIVNIGPPELKIDLVRD